MKHTNKIIASLIGILLLLSIRDFILQKTNKSQPASFSSHLISINSISIISSAPGICHATQVNVSDPQSFLPDAHCTPGVSDTSVTQDNIETTICQKGYTRSIRPPVSYTGPLKRKQIVAYGYSDTSSADYEEDHLISLELGGDPSDPKNLWPEPHPSMNEKDSVENYLHNEICAGHITLSEAQNEIKTNWYQVYMSIKGR